MGTTIEAGGASSLDWVRMLDESLYQIQPVRPPNPFATIGPVLPIPYAMPTGVPELLARPPETGPAPASSPPWLLLAGLGLVAYMMFK
jgi:hypothetical protein